MPARWWCCRLLLWPALRVCRRLVYSARCWGLLYVCFSILILQHMVMMYLTLNWTSRSILAAHADRSHEDTGLSASFIQTQLKMVDSAINTLKRAGNGLAPRNARIVDINDFSPHCQVYNVGDVRADNSGPQNATNPAEQWEWKPKQDAPPFRIYVHELPAEFNTDLVNCINRKYYRDGCFNLDFCGVGVRLANETPHLYVHDTWQFSLEVLIHHKLLSSPYRTHDVSEADLFYVPYYSALDCFCESGNGPKGLSRTTKRISRLFEYLRKTGYFKAEKGSKQHLMVLGKIQREHHTPNCPLLRHPESRRLIFAGIEEEVSQKSIQRSIGKRPMVVVPYPSYAHLNTFSPPTSFMPPLIHSNRTVLLFLAAGRRRSNPFRAGILSQFQENATSKGYQEEMADAHLGRQDKMWLITDECRGSHKYHTLKWMQHSTFCLQPPGDSPTRKSFYDAVLSGCIPVLFNSPKTGKTRYPFSDRFQYDRFTVTIPRSESADVLTFLRLIPSQAVQSLRMELLKVAHYLQYSLPIANTPHNDAIQYMLDEVYQKHLNH